MGKKRPRKRGLEIRRGKSSEEKRKPNEKDRKWRREGGKKVGWEKEGEEGEKKGRKKK